mgnify:FL=1
MPTISMFYGIIIRMYRGKKEHDPPHFPAYYQDSHATFNVETSELMEGNLPNRQIRLVQAWAELHRDELIADWELAKNDDLPYKIEPLK